jgi:hypothetical protein
MTPRDVIYNALLYAIQDREAMVEATRDDDPECHRAKAMANEFRAMLKRRYGTDLTPIEQLMAGAKDVRIEDIAKSEAGMRGMKG